MTYERQSYYPPRRILVVTILQIFKAIRKGEIRHGFNIASTGGEPPDLTLLLIPGLKGKGKK